MNISFYWGKFSIDGKKIDSSKPEEKTSSLKHKERPSQPKKFEDFTLQTLLDKDDKETQQQIGER